MKKSLLLCLSLFLFSFCCAETVKLKNGTFINGSITSQTEYTLNLSTPYGPVVLNQREVEAILPDKHRVHLQGGTQLVGVILDLDEFNLKLQTDSGVVNIDMPQIVSVEVYDYEQGEEAQKAIAQKQAAQAQAAAAATAAQAAAQTGANTTAAPGAVAAGGLSFDSDIEKVFDAKKPEIVNGQVQTVQEISAAEIRAQRAAQMSEEEAFLKGIRPTEEKAIAQTAEAARSGKLDKIKKAEAKKAARPKDSNSSRYFSISVGGQTNDLKLNNAERKGFENTAAYDVGGTSVRAEATLLWRLKSSNLWLGPAVAISNIPNGSFDDKDPAIEEANQAEIAAAAAAGRPVNLPYPPGSDLSVDTSGQLIDLMVKGHYYFNPDSLFSVYFTALAGYRMLSLNYRGVIQGETLNNSTFIAAGGLGVEMWVDDLLLGLEVQEFYSPYSGDFKDSSAANTVASLKFSWKF